MIASPASAAQVVCDRLVEAGIGAILNFAPAILTVPPQVLLRQVDFSVELQVLAFYVAHREASGEPVESRVGARVGCVMPVGCRPRETR